MKFKDFIIEGYSYSQTENSDRVVEYTFTTQTNEYVVAFEFSGSYGWEMSFGVKTDQGIDTRIITNQPQEVMKILNTIFDDILKDFVSTTFKYENSLDIILAPQLMDGESPSLDPFQRKRGKLYVRKIKDNIAKDMFWKDYSVDFALATFNPPAIIMQVRPLA
jgi:hypothetical protein